MSNFFTLSDGKQADATGSFNANVGFEDIPSNTQAKAVIEEVKWDESEFAGRHISIRWSIFEGPYSNRKVFQKVKVFDAKVGDRAKLMLAAIDTNAGGALARLGTEPTDMDLATALMNKPMVIMIQQWKMKDSNTGEDRTGNWVSAVSPLNRAAPAPASQPAAPQQQQPAQSNFDDLPF